MEAARDFVGVGRALLADGGEDYVAGHTSEFGKQALGWEILVRYHFPHFPES